MNSDRTFSPSFESWEQAYLPHLSIDCVVFGFQEGELEILLLKWKHTGAWSLPGGYIGRTESADEAAGRVLRDRTGLERVFLQQFHTFGEIDRGEQAIREGFERCGIPLPPDSWHGKRVVSIGYYALIDVSEATPSPDFLSEECRWWDVRELPPLLMDHAAIVDRALRSLRSGLTNRPIGLNLLPEKFTMPELRTLYEAILGRPLDRRNFQRKILELGIVERLSERRTGGAHRSPYLYRFDPQRYEQALAEGQLFGP